jgi:hypothetical protein
MLMPSGAAVAAMLRYRRFRWRWRRLFLETPYEFADATPFHYALLPPDADAIFAFR